ncbi:winged helix-turn-helix domain-containing protein [bacterium]|nr:winged helix-turn-helix domain-containing protein [bacterium]
MTEALLLLVGSSAAALAPRLSASGYSTLDLTNLELTDWAGLTNQGPVAAVFAADQRHRIAEFRHCLSGLPLLLDLVDDSVDARAEFLHSGADDFWLSGSAPSDLLMRLRLHCTLSQRQPSRPSLLQLKSDDLCLDPSTREVWRAGRALDLTTREFMLLLTLLQHQGRVLSRDQLLQQVWQEERANSGNVVEVYVRYLRQKLEAGGEGRLLHTVRGRGYCLGPLPAQG